MYGLTIRKISEICEASRSGPENGLDVEPRRIVIDSREVREGDLFAAFRGSSTDGNAYIDQAFEKGACCCITDVRPDKLHSGPVLFVENVETAVAEIAKAFRVLLHIPIVGITGSVGKTTAKEMISSVLEQRFTVLKTDKNLNNQLGVPMTISRIDREHEIAVIEMGISRPGDMALLGKIVRPSAAVFTTIGKAHLEFLQDLDGVFLEKTSMLEYMDADSFVVLNGDDPYLSQLQTEKKTVRCGLGSGNDYTAECIEYTAFGNTAFNILYSSGQIRTSVDCFGKHIVSAALLAAAIGHLYGVDDSGIARGIESFRNAGRRGELLRTCGILLFDNCYNANPDSVCSSIDSLVLLPGRRVCILGDMMELGTRSEEFHRDTGKHAKEKGVEILLTCGPLSAFTAEAFGEGSRHFETLDDLIRTLPMVLEKGDSILVQASRGMHFEKISDAIKDDLIPQKQTL